MLVLYYSAIMQVHPQKKPLIDSRFSLTNIRFFQMKHVWVLLSDGIENDKNSSHRL